MTSKKNEITRLADLPVIPITTGNMSFNRTGLWRFLTPIIKSRTAPCRVACPLGMPSPAFISDLAKTNVDQALARILEVNPMPGVTGRLCYHPCQTDCVRKDFDHPVQIQSLERYVADTADAPASESNGEGENERVAVLGAGPVGLTAAYFLGRAGLKVTVFDPLDQPGGFLADLDNKRLPSEVLSREISRLARIAGLDLKMNADPEGLSKAASDDEWKLVLYDKTSHLADNPAAERLAGLADMLAVSRKILNTEKVTPENGYKASQVARAVAAGRELAGEALKAMGKETQAPAFANNSTSEPVPREELRLDVLASQAGGADGLKKDDFSTTRALEEADRCFSCGQCNQCGQCLLFCPDVSIQMDENQKHPVVDLEHCKGCGICAATCPRRVIVMERVS